MDFVVRRARVLQGTELRLLDIGIQGGKIAALAPELNADAASIDAEGMLVVPGLIETHIHLDKTCILDRCRIEEGTVAEAVRETAAAKRNFTADDVYARGSKAIARCISHGTMRSNSPGSNLTWYIDWG